MFDLLPISAAPTMRHHAPALLFLLLLPPGLVQGQERTRFDIVRFDLPTGWTKAESAEGLRFTPAAGDALVDLARSVPLQGTLEAHTQSRIEASKAQPEFRLEVEMHLGRHAKSNGRWSHFVYSRRHPDKAGAFQYEAVLSVAAGGRVVSFTMHTDTVAGYEKNREALGEFVSGVELSTGQRLERGKPPLTRYMVDETVDFLEWLVQSPMTEDQRAAVETDLRRSWKDKVEDEIEGITTMLSARGDLAKLTEAERELARQAVLAEALAVWRKDTENAGSKLMLAIHDQAHQPIAKGEPPLTRQAVEAFAEFLNFAAGRTVDCDSKLPKEVRDQLVAGVAEGYADLAAEQRELIAGMPMVWAALRVAWPDLSAEQKQQYIEGWKQSEPIAALGKALQAQAKAAAEQRSAAESMREMQRNQAALRGQQMHFQMMQNIMTMQNNTMKVMISNLGGNTRYEYRW